MSDLNKVAILGNLTRDPELRYTPSGQAICNLGLASNRKYRKGEELQEEACFVDVSVWGKQGESCAQYLKKGRRVIVAGRLKWDSWDDKNGGGKRSKISIVADEVHFLGDGRNGEQPKGEPDRAPGVDDDIPF